MGLKKLFVVISVALILVFLGLTVCFTYAPGKTRDPPDYSQAVQLPSPVQTPKESEPVLMSEPEIEDVSDVEPEPVPYVSPIDFEALWEQNTDIIAWLDIPNTPISYPIVQNQEDDTYYLNHNSDGESASIGALFSEHTYNAEDFSDLITVVYGHHNRDGSMFGDLQSFYSEEDAKDRYKMIRVFLPDKELDYEVFAAVPYDSVHILYRYGADSLRGKRIFQYELSNVHSLDGYILSDRFPETDEPILILSTCLQGNGKRRYLVLGRLIKINKS